MNKQTVKRLITKGIMAYVAVFSLVLMVAMPAVALIASRNSVNSRAIINGQVKADDIAKGAIRRGKIANGAVRGRHIKDGTIVNADIASDANISASKINRIGLNADLLDGLHASAFASSTHSHDTSYSTGGHDHDTEYSATGHNHNTDYYTKAQSNANYAAASHSHETTKTGYLSIPAVSLTPRDEQANYTKIPDPTPSLPSGQLSTNVEPRIDFFGPVQLPQGSKVVSLSYQFYDNWSGVSDTGAELFRWSSSTGPEKMAGVVSELQSPTWSELADESIDNAIIDNSIYSYYLDLFIDDEEIRAGQVLITYEYTSP